MSIVVVESHTQYEQMDTIVLHTSGLNAVHGLSFRFSQPSALAPQSPLHCRGITFFYIQRMANITALVRENRTSPTFTIIAP